MADWMPTTMQGWMRDVEKRLGRIDRRGITPPPPTPDPVPEHGRITLPGVAAGEAYTVAVTFPAGRFTAAPDVFMNSGSARLTHAALAVTATGFNFQVNNHTGFPSSSCLAYWQAS